MTVKMAGNGHSFLGCTRYSSHRLSSVEANDQWRLCSFIGPFQQYFKKKTFPFDKEESAFPSKQCTGSHVPGTDKFKKFRRIASPSSIFAKFSPRLFSVSQSEEMIRRKKIHHQRALIETEAYFEGLDKSYYSDGLKKLEDRWIK